MPTPNKDESEKDYVKRCIPIVLAEGTAKDGSQASVICHSMYKQHKENENEKTLFTCESKIQFVNSPSGEVGISGETRRMVALVGDKFMNGGFFSWEEAKRVAQLWKGTLHDINHMGTNASALDPRPDIRFFIGYHDNVQIDEVKKQITMDVHVEKDTMYASAWEGYMKLCEQAGKIPNVSTTYYGKRKLVKVSELPEDANYKEEGYSKDDSVPYLYEVEPVCISTVLGGKCDDKAGCGIRNNDNTSCTCETCIEDDKNKDKENKINKELEKEKQEMIAYLKKVENKK
jgi:hypothetical protein